VIHNIYKSGVGWEEKNFIQLKRYSTHVPITTDMRHKIFSNRVSDYLVRHYDLLEDEDNNRYWVILDQDINSDIDGDQGVVKSILDYSQKDNWVVECFKLESKCCITKYYPDHLPVIFSSNCVQLYGSEQDHMLRRSDHIEHFTEDIRNTFHLEAIRQHEMFSVETKCYFDDIQPNNFIADRQFGDPKIIDLCSLVPGLITTSHLWPVDSSRTVG
jgi:hypothetical protein